MVVRETRPKVYTERKFDRGREVWMQVGTGHETVREERVCSVCLSRSPIMIPGHIHPGA
jgi:hypothetical protein